MPSNETTLEFENHPTDRLAVFLLVGGDMSIFIRKLQKHVTIRGWRTIERNGNTLKFFSAVEIDSRVHPAAKIEIRLEKDPNPVFSTGTITYSY